MCVMTLNLTAVSFRVTRRIGCKVLAESRQRAHTRDREEGRLPTVRFGTSDGTPADAGNKADKPFRHG